MGHGAWGMGMEHGAWSMGHGVLISLFYNCFSKVCNSLTQIFKFCK